MKESTKLLGSTFALLGMAGSAFANPLGENVIAGSATVSRDGDLLTVVTGTDRTVINWDDFSIGAGQLANFVQPGVDSAVLNRVVGTMPTEILGTLLSNGQVAVINSNGILIDRSGIVDTRGFTASTLDVSNEAFLSGQSLTFQGDSAAGVTNRGAIIVREGDVFLMGQTVNNKGSVTAENVSLAAGSKIVLKKQGDDHLYVEVESSDSGSSVTNTGSIEAVRSNLRENGNNPYEYAMARDTNEGATGYHVNSDGQVMLSSGGGGSVTHSGTIVAQNQSSGGQVILEAATVEVSAGSKIDATGANEGGSVKIGGGFQGNDATVKNSQVTLVENGAIIDASATGSGNGDGGRVIVWSDGNTFFGGDILARGTGAGAGGFAEVSAKDYLAFAGSADLRSVSGNVGTLLLDPKNLEIIITGLDPVAGANFGTDPSLDSEISPAAILAQLALSDVTLQANNDITVSDAVVDPAATNSLTLEAGRSVALNANIETDGNLTVIANTDNAMLVAADRDLGPGGITVMSGVALNVNDLTLDVRPGGIDAGLISLGGDITTDGSQTLIGDTVLTGDATLSGTVITADAIDAGGNTFTLNGSTSANIGAITNGNLATQNAATIDSADVGTVSVSGGELTVTNNLTASGAISGDQVLDIDGNLVAGSTATASALEVAGTSSLGGNVTTTGTQTFVGATTLTAAAELVATEITAADVDAGGNTLTLEGITSATAGAITNGNLVTRTAATIASADLGTLAVTGGELNVTNNLIASGAITGDQVLDIDGNFTSGGTTVVSVLEVAGTSSLGGNVTTTGTQTFVGATTLTADTELAATEINVADINAGGNILTLDGSVSAVAGAITNGDLVTQSAATIASANLGTLAVSGGELSVTNNLVASGTISGDQILDIDGNLTAGSTTTVSVLEVAGTSSLGGNVTTTGAQTFSGTTVLTADAELSGTVISATSIDAGGSTLTLDGSVSVDTGAITNGNLVTQSAATIDSADLGTLAVSGGELSITNNLAASGPITGDETLDVDGTFTTGSSTMVSVLEVAGVSSLGGNVTTTGALTLSDATILTGDAVLNGTAISAALIDAGGSTLTLNGSVSVDTGAITNGNLVTQSAATIDSANLGTLAVSGGELSITNNLTASGAISGDQTLDIDGNLNAGNTVSGAVLEVAGTSVLSGDVTTTGSQSYLGGLETTVASVALNSGQPVTLGGTLNPNGNPSVGTISVTGDVIFAAGSQFLVDSTGVGSTDLLAVSGQTNLDSIDPLVLGGTAGAFTIGDVLTAITSGTIINASGAPVPVTISGQTFDVMVNATQYQLVRAASDFFWDGDSGNNLWGTGANWMGDLAPGNGDRLAFPQGLAVGASYTANNDILSAVGGILFDGVGADPYTLLINGLDISGGITVTGGTGSHTIATGALTLTGDQTFNSGMGRLIFTDAIQGARNLTLAGAAFTFAGFNNLTGIASTATSITLNGNAITTGNQSYSGAMVLGADAELDGDAISTAAIDAGGNTLTLDGSTSVNTGAITNGNLTTDTAATIASGNLADLVTNGNLDVSGDLTVAGTSSLGGDIRSTGSQTLTGNTSLTADAELAGTVITTGAVDGNGNILTLDGSVSASTGAVTAASLVTQAAAIIASGDLINLTIGGGELTVTNNLTTSGTITGDEILDVDGNLITGGSTMVSVLEVAGTSSLGGNVTTTGAQTFTGATTLTANVELNGTDLATAAINAGGNTLTLDASNSASTGAITNGSLSTQSAATIASGNLDSLSVAGGTLEVGSDLTVSGISTLGADVTTAGTQTLAGNSTLTTDVTLSGDVINNGAIDAGTNTLTLNGATSVTTEAITNGNLVTQSAATIAGGDLGTLSVVSGALNVGNDLNVSGTSTLGANVTTGGTQALAGNTTLTTDVTLGGNVINNGAIDAGTNTLTLNGTTSASTGAITNGNLVTQSTATIASGDLGTLAIGGGDLTATGNLTTSGAITGNQTLDVDGDFTAGTTTTVSVLEVAGNSFLGGNVVTTGDQTYSGQVVLNTDVELDGAAIIAGDISGSSGLETLTLDGSVSVTTGAVSALDLITQSAATIDSGDVATLFVGGGELTVTNDLAVFGTVTGDQTLDVNGNYNAGSTTSLAALEVAGIANLLGNVTTTGAQTLSGGVILATDVILDGTVIDTGDINATGNTLTLMGSTSVNTGAITNGDLVTQSAATIASGDLGTLAVGGGELNVTNNLTVAGAITGNQTLDVDGNLTTGSTTVVSVLEVAGTSSLGGNVTTTGAQTLTGATTLNTDVLLAGSVIQAGTIDAGGNILTLNGSTSVNIGAITNGDLVTLSAATIASGDLASLMIGGGELNVTNNLTVLGAINGNRTLDIDGNLNAGSTIAVANLEVAGTSSLGGNVTTTGDQTFSDDTTLTTDVELAGSNIATGDIDAGGNTLTLDGLLSVFTGDISNGDLVIQSAATVANATVGTLTIGGGELNVTGDVTASGAITGPQTLDVDGNLDAGSIVSVAVLEVGGTSSLSGNVITTGAQTLVGNTTLTTDVELDGTIVTTGTINAGGNTLTLDGSFSVNTGAISNGDLVTQTAATIASGDLASLLIGGGELTVINDLAVSGTIVGDQILDVNGNLTTGSTTMVSVLEVAGTSNLGGNVTTTGGQTLAGGVTLNADVELAGTVISTGAINANGNTLTLNGSTSVNTGAITNGNLVTTTAVTIDSGSFGTVMIGGGELTVTNNLTTTGTITGAQTLDVNGNLEAGSTTTVSVLEVAGTSSFDGNVTTTGAQTLVGDVSLLTDVELDGTILNTGAINAGGNLLTLDGSTSVTTGVITNGSLVTRTAVTAGGADLNSLVTAAALNSPGSVSVSGMSTLGGNVTTTGDQNYVGDLALTTDVELDGAAIRAGMIDAGTNTLTLDGSVSVDTGAISNGNLVTQTAATVANATIGTLSISGGELNVSNDLIVGGAITGNQTLDVDGNLTAGGTTTVAALEVAGTSSLSGNVTTTGAQTLEGDTTLTTDVTLDGTAIATGNIGAGGNTLTLDGSTSVATGAITNGNLVTRTAATVASANLGSVLIGGGELNVTNDLVTTDTISGDQILDVDGNLTAGSTTMVSVLEVAGTSTLGGNVTTIGAQTYVGATTLTADVEMDGTAISAAAINGGGNTLTLDGSTSVNTGAISNANLITQTAATIASGDLGTVMIGGGALGVTGDLTASGAIAGDQSLDVDGNLATGSTTSVAVLDVAGTSSLGGDVTTVGTQTFVGATNLTADAELDGTVVSASTIDGGGNTLTLDGSTSVNTGAITNGNLITQTAATIASGDIGTGMIGGGTLHVLGDLSTGGAVSGDQFLDIDGNLRTGGSLTASLLEVDGNSVLRGNVTTTGDQTYRGNVSTITTAPAGITLMGGNLAVAGDLSAAGALTLMGGDVTVTGAFTSTGNVTLKGGLITVINPNNDFDNGSAVDLQAATVNIVDANFLQVGGNVVGNLDINVGRDAQGNSLNFNPLTVGGDLNVSATGNINQIGEANVGGLTNVTSTQGIINLNIDENNFIDVVTLTGDQITVSTSADLKLGDIVTTASTGPNDPNGTFTINASANVTQVPGKTINVNKLQGSVVGEVSVILFNEGNQINEIGDITLIDGGNFYLRDSGRQAGSATPAALTVNGNITGDGSLWLIVDGATDTDKEGITFAGGGSIHLTALPGQTESLVLIGGFNDTNGLSGTGELIIPKEGNGTRVSASGGASAYLLFNTVSVGNGGSNLTGISVGGRDGDFQSLNFSFDPGSRVSTSGDAVIDALLAGRTDTGFEGDLAAVLADPAIDNTAALNPLFQSRVPRFINSPSFLFTQAARIDTDTASQASDVATLTRSFFDDLEAIEQIATLTKEEIAAIRDVSRFEGGAYGLSYGPFAILSYEYDWWLAENDQKPGVVLDEDEKIYGGVYPLYLRKTKDGKIVPAIED